MTPEQLDQKLETTRPTLSDAEVTALWHRIAKEMATPAPVPSPYHMFAWMPARALSPLALMLVVVLGLGSTVAVSEAAKPGDLLFPVERAVEQARLIIASEEYAAELRATFAAKRLGELEAILAEEGTYLAHDDGAFAALGEVMTFEAEADVFTDTTVVKVEVNDITRVFTTNVRTREAVVAEIARQYPVAPERIDAALDFEVEGRASRPGERGIVAVDGAGESRISAAASELLNMLEEVEDDRVRDELLGALVSQIDNVSVKGKERKGRGDRDRLDIRGDDSRVRIDDKRIEVREDGYRIRIDADGEVKVKEYGKSRNDDSDEWDEEDERDDSRGRDRDEDRDDDEDDDGESHGRGRGGDSNDDDEDDDDEFEFEDAETDEDDRDTEEREEGMSDDVGKVEVRVEDGEAQVRVEYDGHEFEYETVYLSRSLLVADISARTGISEAEIELALDIEIKE